MDIKTATTAELKAAESNLEEALTISSIPAVQEAVVSNLADVRAELAVRGC